MPQPGSDDEATDEAPKVTQPITDTARFDENPCLALSRDQLASLGMITEGQPGNGGTGPNCHWELEQGSFTITVVDNPDGLSDVYQNRARMGFFQPVDPIQGHPAVLYGPDNRLSKGDADLLVGINNHSIYSIDLSMEKTSDFTQVQQLTEHVTDMMLTTMKNRQTGK